MSEEKLSEFEMQLIDNIIAQFKFQMKNKFILHEDLSKITYNDYYKNQGINYIKRNVKVNHSFLDPVFKQMAQNIKTPLEEWEERFPKQNDKPANKVEVYESNYYY